MSVPNLDEINNSIADRLNVFYWQTDRIIEPHDVAHIWSDRHSGITSNEILSKVCKYLENDPLVELEELDLSSPTSLGNINSVRLGKLKSGQDVVIRCHPKGILNGYFNVETLVSNTLIKSGLPGYKTFCVHDFEGGDDFAFQVIERLPGVPVQTWLKDNSEDEITIMHEVGKTMAKMHKIEVEGFGPFDNSLAKSGQLRGLHNSFIESLRASLEANLEILKDKEVISPKQSQLINNLFSGDNDLLHDNRSVLVHNDFADWNQMTDGKTITGIIDLDEVIASNPVCDIACWSTFFEPRRLDLLISGYFEEANKPDNFEELFELLRLRYIVSKMTLRLRKSSWDQSQNLKEMIRRGSLHLQAALKYFGI